MVAFQIETSISQEKSSSTVFSVGITRAVVAVLGELQQEESLSSERLNRDRVLERDKPLCVRPGPLGKIEGVAKVLCDRNKNVPAER